MVMILANQALVTNRRRATFPRVSGFKQALQSLYRHGARVGRSCPISHS